jgi:2-dehydro-3-deoxyphosphogalactonate aldolase
MLKQALAQNGLIAILRGLRPDEAAAIGEVLYAAGFRVIEVPLNSPTRTKHPHPARSLPADCLIGAGTVLTPEQVEQVKAAGGQVIVMPQRCQGLARRESCGLYLSPGVATPTEAFAALAEGADVLKLFPAEQMGRRWSRRGSRCWRARCCCRSAASPGQHAGVIDAGAKGFGLGSGLFKPGMTVDQVASRAQAYVAA